MERKNFMFYLNWEEQINLMTDPELRKFILNLIRYHKGEPVELVSKVDKLTWAGILPALESNNDKYDKRVKANQENGKKGGAPIGNKNAKKDKTTQNNPNNLIKEKGEKISDKGEKINENGEELTDEGQMENDNSEEDNGEQINGIFKKETGNSEADTENNIIDNSNSNNSKLICKSETKQLLNEIFIDYCPEWEEELLFYDDIDSFFSKYKKYLKLYSQLDLDKIVDLTGIKCSRVDWLKNVINDYWIDNRNKSSDE